MYLTLRKKYTEAEAQTMGEMLGMAVAELDEKPDQDLLGEIFMTLGLGNEHNGQFFTPTMYVGRCPNSQSEILRPRSRRRAGYLLLTRPAAQGRCWWHLPTSACGKRSITSKVCYTLRRTSTISSD